MFPIIVLILGLVAAYLCKRHGLTPIDGKYLLIFAGFEVLAFIISLTTGSKTNLLNSVTRPEYGQGPETRKLQVARNGQWEDIEIDISEKDIPEGITGELLSGAYEQILAELLGDNEDADHVWRDLVISDSYQNGSVTAVWSFEPEGYIQGDGSVEHEVEVLPADVTASVYLKCGDDSIQRDFPLRIVPVDATSDDGFRYYVRKSLHNADEAGGDEMNLPQEVEGIPVSWKEETEDTGRNISIFGLIVLFVLIVLGRSEEKRKKEDILHEKTRNYPDIVSGLSLYVGAGFSVKQAFERISESYEADLEKGRRSPQAGFEEICMLVRQIHGGKSELEAYEELGTRSGVPCYKKLSMLLCANLRKGNRELLDQLEAEEEAAFEDRKMRARVAGEEASTKLLIPMMGLLLVIMVVLVVPSFMNIM